MTDHTRKKKMVILRLSEAEYEILKSNYRSFGVHSVSEFANLALQRTLVESATATGEPAPVFTALEHRVSELEARVSLLIERDRVSN